MAPSPPSLPRHRVCVGQFPLQPTGAPSRYDGRVKPLVAGQVARFHALEALLAFMTRALADMLCTPTQGGQRPRAVEAVALEGTISVSSKEISYGHLEYQRPVTVLFASSPQVASGHASVGAGPAAAPAADSRGGGYHRHAPFCTLRVPGRHHTRLSQS